MEPNDRKRTCGEAALLIGALLLVIVVWLGSYWYITSLEFTNTKNIWEQRGQYGDMFGAVNSLFSGLAFAGIIFTIYLQRQELRAQRKELQLTREELQLTREEFQTQNVTLKRQRFETTFFNMLSIHFQTREKLQTYFVRVPNELESSISAKGKKSFIGANLNVFTTVYNRNIDTYYIQLSGYFQSLLSLYEVIREQRFQESATSRYLSILNSYISLQEKVFLFYHITLADENAIDKRFYNFVNDMELASIHPERLIDPSHIQLLEHIRYPLI